MGTYYFRVFMKCRKGHERGMRQMGKCVVHAANEKDARLRVLDFINFQNNPVVPPNATSQEQEHIETNWCRWRMEAIEPVDPEFNPEVQAKLHEWNRTKELGIFWWGWDQLVDQEN